MSAHCQHCHPDCTGGTVYDPDDSGTRHWAHDDAFDWHDDYGCPICNDAALLRRESGKRDAEAARLARQRAGLDAKVLRAEAAALRAVAVLIEAGES